MTSRNARAVRSTLYSSRRVGIGSIPCRVWNSVSTRRVWLNLYCNLTHEWEEICLATSYRDHLPMLHTCSISDHAEIASSVLKNLWSYGDCFQPLAKTLPPILMHSQTQPRPKYTSSVPSQRPCRTHTPRSTALSSLQRPSRSA
jgi:hypothetical protein